MKMQSNLYQNMKTGSIDRIFSDRPFINTPNGKLESLKLKHANNLGGKE